MKGRFSFLAPLAIASLFGCAELTAPERDLTAPIQTGDVRYSLTREVLPHPDGPIVRLTGKIDYLYRNPAQRAIYVIKCETVAFVLERLDEDNVWQQMWAGSDYARCLGPPTVIESDQFYADTLHVGGVEPTPLAEPEFASADWPGIYRMVLLGAIYLEDPAGYPDGTPVEEEHLYSNQFVLERN